MSHPFEKMFIKALAQSRGDENHVLDEAEKLLEKGYAAHEIYEVLTKLKQALIIDAEEKIVAEAVEEFMQYVDVDETQQE